mmetsp:Transcript_13092/g.14545  ORF Transcript_13092/g.14545 Transcript_13092/m.14545 type:complete len:142 (-) Transcript_13092:19-444(-)
MSKGAFNRFLLKSSQIIIRFSHPGITVYQQQFFSSSLSLSSFPFPLNRSILPLRQQLKLVVGGQRCTSFPSTNSMPSSSCCYHFTTTATATTTTTTTLLLHSKEESNMTKERLLQLKELIGKSSCRFLQRALDISQLIIFQ